MRSLSSASFVALAAAAALAACSSPVKLNDAPVESRTPGASAGAGGSSSTAPGAQAGRAGQSGVASVDLTRSNAAADANLGRVVYFDYDSFVIRDEFKPVIEGHAKAMAGNRGKRAVVEGHADERGSHEYNLALGQKRAEAVARSLALMGVTPTQVEAVSYGEERPAVQGADESAYAKNRRAELKDR